MRGVAWVGLSGAGVAAVLAAVFASGLGGGERAETTGGAAPPGRVGTSRPTPAPAPVPLFSAGFIDDSGFEVSQGYIPAIADRGSLAEVAAAYRERADLGRADVRARLVSLERESPRTGDFDRRRALLQLFAGLLDMYEGKFVEAGAWFERAERENPGLDPAFRANIGAMRGVAALRRGEVENCVACLGPSSCIYPISAEARHLKPEGSREAIRLFTAYLDKRPDDLGVRWLLNVAAMTLGEHPGSIPPALRIMDAPSAGSTPLGRFDNVAAQVGLTSRGPNMLGGSVFDDFTGDDRPDILVASGDWDKDAALFINGGDGTYKDAGTSAGLTGQVLGVNLAQADYDNDGRLDALILRGGWEGPMRLSLLRNAGGGTFADVTVDAGLFEPIATQSAAWGDFDNDGWLDLFVCGEYQGPPDPRNRSRLYRNKGDGTFVDVAAEAGVLNERWAKGATWGDYDDDGFIDLYVSNMNGLNRLYKNLGGGRFSDVAPGLGLTGPIRSFSCWFWDYDDDGRPDIFVAGFAAWMDDIVADRLGRTNQGERPRLYRNVDGARFREVSGEVGLDKVWVPMGSNFADIDNDGHLDLYLATGRPAYSYLCPNVLMLNVDGRFVDATTASGTGHLQKGHGVSFADGDDDGDLDLFVAVGGQTPGDKAHNLLFRNPGNGHHSIRLKLVGTKANRSAIGAKLRLDLVGPGGARRSIHRVVNGGSSFGGNSLAPTIGLGDADRVDRLTIIWPGSGTVQTLRDLPAGRSIEITEGAANPRTLPRPDVKLKDGAPPLRR